jgi:hypothetical protein
MRVLKIVAAFLAALLVTTVAGTVFQSQFNLAQLTALGVSIPMGLRLETTARDLAGFAPNFGALSAAAFLVAFTVTGLIRRWLPQQRTALYALAGAVAIWAMLMLMELALGLTAIAAARTLAGFTSLVVAGALGGWVFAVLSRLGNLSS